MGSIGWRKSEAQKARVFVRSATKTRSVVMARQNAVVKVSWRFREHRKSTARSVDGRSGGRLRSEFDFVGRSQRLRRDRQLQIHRGALRVLECARAGWYSDQSRDEAGHTASKRTR